MAKTMIFKLEGDMENYIGNIRWAQTIGMSMLNLRATRTGFGTVGGTSYVQPRLAAHYLEDTGILRIYRHGQETNREISDIIPITCVLNLHFRNLSMW